MKKKNSYSNPQKIFQKSTKHIKLSTIFGRLRVLNNQSYQISEAIFQSHFFITFHFSFCHMTPEGLKIWIIRLDHLRRVFLIENSCLNYLKIVYSKITKKIIFLCELHKPLWRVKKRPFLQLADAQTTGFVQRRLPEVAAIWR